MEDGAILAQVSTFLTANEAVASKVTISQAYAPAQKVAGRIQVGDDCAAIPDGEGYLLLAAEGMLESFVQSDPWFAGYSAVMVNLSDVAAMGGWPLAIVDVLWTPEDAISAQIWAGLSAASEAYEVPIVGGHTTRVQTGPAYLAAAVLGKAETLITSFGAQPQDDLLMVIDLRGAYRGPKPFWNASVGVKPQRLRRDLRLWPDLAAQGWCHAGKDISNGGIVGTLTMLLHCSRVGAELWLDQLPRPDDGDLLRWLVAFPSYGYLLSVPPEQTRAVQSHFTDRGIACAHIGVITDQPSLVLRQGQATLVWLTW